MSEVGHKSMLPRFLRRARRRLWCRITSPRSELVYHEKYNSAFPNVPNDPLRAERILAFLAAEGLVLRRHVHKPLPATLRQLEAVHDPAYLDRVHEETTLGSIMGCEITPEQVDRLIDLQRLHTGGTLLATRRARKTGIAVNLGGGFHHALSHQGGGFCIFNDVAVAIAEERRRGFRGRVLIVDLDLHDGNGTRDIFAADPDVYTFSVHARNWEPDEAVSSTSLELGSDVGDDVYLEAIRSHLPEIVHQHRPQLAFYLAGTDPAHDDELGEWRISARGLLERDRFVVDTLRPSSSSKVPLVILLAGGYSRVTWRYSARFLSAFLCVRGPIEPPSTEEITLARYRYISSLFDPAELSGGADDGFGLTEEDLFLPGWGVRPETRFLSFYTRHGIELVLERAGFLDRIRDLGFDCPRLEFDLNDPGGHTLRMWTGPQREEVLVELRVRRDRRSLEGVELLSIEWLLMQNPRATFTDSHRPLPGQKYPGLGMLSDMMALLAMACGRLHLDGIIFVPSQFHIANHWKGHMFFVRPEVQARFEALLELFEGVPLGQASRTLVEGRVVDENGEVVRWQPEPMLAAISDRLRERLARERKAADVRFRYRLTGDDDGLSDPIS